LHWDNSELVFQSKRVDVYNQIIDDLIRRDLAYKAYETPAELDALRKQAEQQKKAFIYRRWPLTDEPIRQYESEGRPSVVRFAMPVKEYRFHDVVLRKEIALPPEQVQDFVIRKADGMPTYHFAVVVDDAAMGVTHILRGQEHLLNTVNHIGLQDALGYARPTYGHLPIILNTDGSKMGKRDRDKKIRHHAVMWQRNTKTDVDGLATASGLLLERVREWIEDDTQQLDGDEQHAVMKAVGMKESELPEILVHDFRRNGYLPEVLLNFLALLGWNPGGNKERMSVEEMVQLFTIEGIGKANARFDRNKLLAFNTEGCASVPPARLLAAFKDYLSVNPDSPLNGADDSSLMKVLQIKPGFRTLREVDETSRFFFVPDDQISFDADAVEKVLRKGDNQGLTALRDLRDILAAAADWTAHTLEAAVKQYCDQKQLGLGKVAQPIRVAISGGVISPPIFQSLEFLGQERTLRRMERCLAAVG
jgi:glutamyl-tRNA synthetase